MTGERASKDIQRSSRAAILCGPSWRLASCRLRTWEQREPTRRLDSTYFKILSAALLVLIVLEGWKSHEEFTVSVVHIHKVWQDLVRRGLFNSFYLEDRPLYACAHQRHMIPLTIKTQHGALITFSPYSKDFKGSLSQREAWAFPAPREAFSTSGRSEALCRSLWNDQRKGRNCERNDIHNISQSLESSHVRMSFPAR